ncbi:MAG: 2OG-Fe(II) oxygenase [Rhodospirillaceae bacterium]|nr:2OG-Fe(II) oxygenase [Rhodospirillaceae bacterium]
MRLEHPYCVIDRGLSTALCQRIVETGESAETMPGSVIRDPENNTRDSHVAWLSYGADTAWLFDAVGQIVADANARYWNWTLSGPESMQYTHYGPDQYYSWHADQRKKPYPADDSRWPGLTRKLTAVVSLSQHQNYIGGDFMLETLELPPDQPDRRLKSLPEIRNMGSILVFPSFLYHQVTAVSAGHRRSLVAWFLGPPFV